MTIAAGDLDQRITLQQRVSAAGTYGDDVGAWADVCTVWAAYKPMGATLRLAAATAQRTSDSIFVIRHRDLPSGTLRLMWRGEPYAVDAVLPLDGNRWALQLQATKGVRDGR
jgi:SPP1 family predicted phage head-tail adaptor